MQRSTCERAAAAADVVRALSALPDAGQLDFVLYASEGELRAAIGCRQALLVTPEAVILQRAPRAPLVRRTSDPFAELARLARRPELEGSAFYGYLGFDLCRFYLPYRPAAAGPLAHLMAPRLELCWRGSRLRLRGDRAWARVARAVLEQARPARRRAPGSIAEPAGAGGLAYRRAVARAIDAVKRGKLVKAIVSRRVPQAGRLDVLGTWERMAVEAPAARWFAFQLGDAAGVGASPELLLEANGRGRVVTNPLAGTRPRGTSRREDDRLRAELLDDPKELREHLMSVDLAVDELLSVCRPRTVEPSEFMEVRRYRRVQHLSSRIEGRLARGATVWDALRAVFPGVTVSGIPKAAAVRLIGQLEPEPRGIYSGAAGWIDGAGRCDLSLAIRAAFDIAGRSFVQSGAGILEGSRPAAEYDETRNKLRTILDALTTA